MSASQNQGLCPILRLQTACMRPILVSRGGDVLTGNQPEHSHESNQHEVQHGQKWATNLLVAIVIAGGAAVLAPEQAEARRGCCYSSCILAMMYGGGHFPNVPHHLQCGL